MSKENAVNPKYPHFLHGGDYNPDQWTKFPEIIDEDMRLIPLANCNAMSVGIFAWAALEPEEGKYDFTVLDNIMDRLDKIGAKAILATPSGAKPTWMGIKYPEIRRVNEMGLREKQGVRHNHCYTSPVYREKVKNINTALAKRYKDHNALILWHISNEYSGECHCDLCQEAFRKWLFKKYDGDLDKLNYAWWTGFWAHTYTDWSQIEPPSSIGERHLLELKNDWMRFVTAQTADFLSQEVKVLKAITPDVPVTTNFMEFYSGLDYKKLAKEIDVISWDSYPRWDQPSCTELYPAKSTAFVHDMFRSYKNKPFLLMESCPGVVNHHPHAKIKAPGVSRLLSMQAVAHGSDSVLYFQWRKSRGSWEKLHGAVVDHCGHENTKVFKEVSEVGAVLKKMDDIIGTYTESEVAVFYDTENKWLYENMQGLGCKSNKAYDETAVKHYEVFWKNGINTDIINYESDLSKYKLVIMPQNYMIPENFIPKMEKYVSEGGVIVATYLLGMADENDLCYLGGFPGGKLKDLFGVWAEAFDSLYPHQDNSVIMNKKTYKAVDFCTVMHTTTAQTLAVFDKDFYKGEAALCKNEYGKGAAYYIGFRDNGDFINELYGGLIAELNINKSFAGQLENGVSAHSRHDNKYTYVFLQNYNPHKASAVSEKTYMDFFTKEQINGTITLAPYETRILREEN